MTANLDTRTEVTTGHGYGPVTLSADLTEDGILASRDEHNRAVIMVYAPNAGSLFDEANYTAIFVMADRWGVDVVTYVVPNWATPLRYVAVDLASHPDAAEFAAEILSAFHEYCMVDGAEDILSALEFEEHEQSIQEGWHDEPCDRCPNV